MDDPVAPGLDQSDDDGEPPLKLRCLSCLLTLRAQTGSPNPNDGINTFPEFFECILPQVTDTLPSHPSPVELFIITTVPTPPFPPLRGYHLLYLPPPLTHIISDLLLHRLSLIRILCYISLSPMLHLFHKHVSRGLSDDPWFGPAMPQFP